MTPAQSRLTARALGPVTVTTEEHAKGVRIVAAFQIKGSRCTLERVVPEDEAKAVTAEMVEACEAMRSRDE